MKYLLDTDFAIDEIHVLYRSDTDIDDILILIIPIPIPIPITYHLKFIPPVNRNVSNATLNVIWRK